MNEIYSVRSYPTLFVYTCFDIDAKKLVQYVISRTRNDIVEILKHLEDVKNQIGFGNLSKDYYFLHSIIESRSFIGKMSSMNILSMLERISKKISSGENDIIEKKYMSQCDLERFFGFTAFDKNISLTDLKIALGEMNVTDTSFKFGFNYGLDEDNMKKILTECIYDVRTIIKLYYIAIGKSNNPNYSNVNLISARYKLCEETNISGINYPPTLFAKLYFIKLYQKLGGTYNTQELTSKAKFNDNTIHLKNCVPYYAVFSSREFNDVVNKIVAYPASSNPQFLYTTSFAGIPLKFGMGGLHGCDYSGKYEIDEDHFIVDIDIVSDYAAIATGLSIKPRHMDDNFIKAMKEILEKRISYLRKSDDVSKGIVVLTKSILNYIYGKTREEDSPFYDLEYSAKVIIAAQLLMAKFMEFLKNRIDDIKFLMVNTDAITFIAPKSSKEKILEAMSNTKELIPTIRFKVKTYDKIFIKDVNNYLAYNSNGITARGIFDYNVDITKDNSSKIIPKLLRDILVFNKSIDDALKDYDINDYLIKAKTNSKLSYTKLVDGIKIIEMIQNPSRFYYSRDYKSSGYVSKYINGAPIKFCDNFPVTLLNDTSEGHPEINYLYYKQIVEEILCEVNFHPDKSLLF